MAVSNGSMAVWCSLKQGGRKTEIETHFNYWRVAGTGQRAPGGLLRRDFLEVGVLLFDPSEINHISIFVPFVVAAETVEDLGTYFGDPDIAQGIFNEVLSSDKHSLSGEQWINLLCMDDSLFCRVHVFLKQNNSIDSSEICIKYEGGGTIITILPHAVESSSARLPVGGRLYFRLRIYAQPEQQSPFVNVITPTDRHFQSGFEEVEYVDFRLNEARTLPAPIERQMKRDAANGRASINRVAFLTAVPVLSELSVSNTAFYKNRLLEHDPWDKYVPGGIPQGMMVYHWRKGEPGQFVDDFTAFVKLQTRRTSNTILLIYLVIAFLFGIVGNLTASGIVALYQSYYAEKK
ncbi:hypothetical protein [Azospirillum himalayense]|uniref:Uncharacterized protein n=1 Tax=Azospirillum himalayense TaxID=654847 RepID=A0ABW0G5M1_9PROT